MTTPFAGDGERMSNLDDDGTADTPTEDGGNVDAGETMTDMPREVGGNVDPGGTSDVEVGDEPTRDDVILDVGGDDSEI